jgi:hypothetical protein
MAVKIRSTLKPLLGLALSMSLAPTLLTQPHTTNPTDHTREPTMTTRANGSFEVELTPQPPAEGESPAISRMVLFKRFSGDLEATSQGQMLAFRTPTDGSAGYVAMEQVSGTLGGRRGSFVLQHSGIMERGAPSLTLLVVPDSGTDELEGLSGTMDIIIEQGHHRYEFDYRLPSRP